MGCCSQEIIDAIDNFYKLKNKYEIRINKEKEKIRKNDLLSKKEKIIEYNKIKKKCIKCGKQGGSIFLIKNEGNERKYIAKCNASEKCKLDIEIILGSYDRMDNIIPMLKEYEDNIKWNITKLKLDLLFSYESEEKTLQMFNENKKELDETIAMNRKILTDFLMITDNYIKNQNINQNNIEIYNNIKLLKQHVKLYEETDDIEHIKEALQIYRSRIIPISERNLNMKYNYVGIENHPFDDDIYILRQDKYITSDIEININDVQDKIIKNNY
jgi:hypothetical protein